MSPGQGLPTKILIVDDDAFNREGILLYLERHGFSILEAGDAAAAYEIAVQNRPDAAIIDIVIPPIVDGRIQTSRSEGVHLAGRLKRALPTLGVVLFSAHEDRGSEVWDLVRAGTRGLVYKLKGSRPTDVLKAVHDALAGHVMIDPEVLANPRSLVDELIAQLSPEERPWVLYAATRLNHLSEREREIARRLAASHNTQGIALSLGISPKTVENHVGHIYEKLGLREMAGERAELRKVVILAKACMMKELLAGEW